MSRIGKKAISIPKDVSVSFENTSNAQEDKEITIQGKFGILKRLIGKQIFVNVEENKIILTRINEEKKTRELHGLYRALIQNMVTGVANTFSKTLIAEGVGYRFQMEQNRLVINVGFTNPIQLDIPSDLKIKLESNTKIQLSGIDREKVGFFAAKIRDMRPPEPYKGKGILYEGEKIIRKAGKTGK
jgi:large subunit ribosomal protein L6